MGKEEKDHSLLETTVERGRNRLDQNRCSDQGQEGVQGDSQRENEVPLYLYKNPYTSSY